MVFLVHVPQGINPALSGLVSAGPKLFKEPSSKSNKPIIHNAVSHCCLAGKVNEPHKNSILEASMAITAQGNVCQRKGIVSLGSSDSSTLVTYTRWAPRCVRVGCT